MSLVHHIHNGAEGISLVTLEAWDMIPVKITEKTNLGQENVFPNFISIL